MSDYQPALWEAVMVSQAGMRQMIENTVAVGSLALLRCC